VRFNIGYYGEYLTFSILEKIKGNKYILANVYIPKENKNIEKEMDETSEIDLMMLHETGIYVFESKNYSGWIYGREKDRFWTQVLNKNVKNRFYNPIKQNDSHIKHLSNFLSKNKISKQRYFSIIVFSERCELKNVTYENKNVKVLKRNNLKRYLEELISNNDTFFSDEELKEIYDLLKQLSKVSDEIKQKHIESIKNKINKI